jgi:hypothetical protein
MSSKFHLAQINIGRILDTTDSELMSGFMNQLDEINGLADNSPGFVWRLVSEDNNATSLRPYADPFMLINISVWETIEDLHNYVYRSLHNRPLARRKEWFERMDTPIFALWWVPAGHIPTVEEGKERIELLTRLGPTPEAFTFKNSFPPPEGD